MNILVTGAAGFIGMHLAEKLSARITRWSARKDIITLQQKSFISGKMSS